jgi:aminomethyltransferase
LLCVNASNTNKDFAWIQKHISNWGDVIAENESDKWSQLAVQGPTSFEALSKICTPAEAKIIEELPYTHICQVGLYGQKSYVARTGYTGEKGYEIYLPNAVAEQTWTSLLDTNPSSGIKPIGLGARDTLRLEACYLLYGSDMNDSVSPLEAGIGWATKIDAKDFIGKDIISAQKTAGVNRRIYAFKLVDKGIARHDMRVLQENTDIGFVTSGSVLPTVGGAGGMAMLSTGVVKVGDKIEINVRGKMKAAIIVKRPIYQAKVKS